MIEQKLQEFVDNLAQAAETNGSSHFSTSDSYYYGWDKDLWNHRHSIIEALKGRGFIVEVSTKWEVTDINIIKPIKLC